MTSRYSVLDILRGIALINMIIYHAVWDVVYLFGEGLSMPKGSYFWQQAICFSFIIISGFCSGLGKNNLKRSVKVILLSFLISAVTSIFLYENRVIFGILTLIGSCMLIISLLDGIYKKINPLMGFIVSIFLFAITKNIAAGYVNIFGFEILMPDWLYKNTLTAYFGFPESSFFSTDYFPLIPWMILYKCGYFLQKVFVKFDLIKVLSVIRCKPLEFIGRRSLFIYVIHQPVIYGLLYIFFWLLKA